MGPFRICWACSPTFGLGPWSAPSLPITKSFFIDTGSPTKGGPINLRCCKADLHYAKAQICTVIVIRYKVYSEQYTRAGWNISPKTKYSTQELVGIHHLRWSRSIFFFFFLLPTPPFSPCEGRQPILFFLLCSLVVLAWASICLGVLNKIDTAATTYYTVRV